MSHLASIAIRISNRQSLAKALTKMGVTFAEGNALRLFNDYWERRYKSGERFVQILIGRDQIHERCKTDVGFRWDAAAQSYELISDPMELDKWVNNPACTGHQSFVHQLHENYAIAQLEAQIGQAAIVSRQVLEDGTVRLVVETEDAVVVEQSDDMMLSVRR